MDSQERQRVDGQRCCFETNNAWALMRQGRMEFVANLGRGCRRREEEAGPYCPNGGYNEWPCTASVVCGDKVEHSFWSTVEQFDKEQWKAHLWTFDCIVEFTAPVKS